MSLKNAWKNKDVFEKQLQLNLQELREIKEGQFNYPAHWYLFLNIMHQFSPRSVLDVGCGVGAYYKLCERHLPNTKYTGVDYSADAIEIAKNAWPYGDFAVKDMWGLTEEDVSSYDVIFVGALLDVMPDADAALDFLLNLYANNVFISRIRLTNEPSHYNTYIAYEEIETCDYYHNNENFKRLIESSGYEVVAAAGDDYGTGFAAHYYLSKGKP